MRGCRIFASDKHLTKSAGELIGWCEKVDGNICLFTFLGEADRFIWRFGNGELNDWYFYGA